MIYDKVILKGQNTNQNSVNNSNNGSSLSTSIDDNYIQKFYLNLKNNRTVLNDYDHNINIILDKEGNVYYSGASGKTVGEKGSYTIEGYEAGIDANGKMSNILEGYKLNIFDVVMFFHGITGNGGWQDYIFVKSDGSVAKLTYDVDYKTKMASIVNFEDNISKYKNIVGIQIANTWDAHDYKLIDIYGNKY